MKDENLITKVLGPSVNYTIPLQTRADLVVAERIGMVMAVGAAQNKAVWIFIIAVMLNCCLVNFDVITGYAFWYNLLLVVTIQASWLLLKSYTLGTAVMKSHFQIEILKRDWIINHLVDNQADPSEQADMKTQYFTEGDQAIADMISKLGGRGNGSN